MHRYRWLVLLSVLSLCALGCWIGNRFKPFQPPDDWFDRGALAAPNVEPYEEEVFIQASPVQHPEFVAAVHAPVLDDEIVIGVMVDDEPRAYLRSAFDNDPAAHVVYDRLGSLNFAVTHCDHNRCTRVLAAPAGEPLSVWVGGWNTREQSMILVVSRERYLQSSEEIPLADVTHVETTWGLWRTTFPDSLVYVSPPGQERSAIPN